jgi:hypothetical protein
MRLSKEIFVDILTILYYFQNRMTLSEGIYESSENHPGRVTSFNPGNRGPSFDKYATGGERRP